MICSASDIMKCGASDVMTSSGSDVMNCDLSPLDFYARHKSAEEQKTKTIKTFFFNLIPRFITH